MRGRRVRLAIGVVGTIAAVGAEWVALDNVAPPGAGAIRPASAPTSRVHG